MINTQVDEKVLIKAVKSDDALAYKEICSVYYDPLYRFLWRKTRNAEISKDLIQDLFINVWKLRRQLDETKSFKAYLYKSANNLAVNHLKQKVMKQNYLGDHNLDEVISKDIDPNELSEYIDDVLQGIPDAQCTVFILNKFEGFKYAEIAEIMQISVKTVESRMSKILKTLREKLAPLLILAILLFYQMGRVF